MNKIFVLFLLPLIIELKITNVIEINRIGMRTSRHFKNDLLDKFYGRIMNVTPHGLNHLRNLEQLINIKYIEENIFYNVILNQNNLQFIHQKLKDQFIFL